MVAPTPTPSTATDTGPLDWRIAITDSGGRPTPEFQRRWNTQRNNNGKIGTTIGHGSPAGLPDSDGLTYINEDTDPATLYVSYDGAWHQVSAIDFTDLLDAPHNYTSAGDKLVRVNGAATGLEFATFQSYLDGIGAAEGDILYRGSAGWVALAPGTSGNVLTTAGPGADPTWATPSSGTGTVSSVALTAPSIFSVSGSPITTSGTLALALATQSANLMFAGPASGSAASPTFRSLVAADLPLATTSAFGAVKPDGTTITISAGVITAVGGGGGGGVTAYFGTGAPSGLHNDGDLYFDTSTTPFTGYVQQPATGGAVIRGTTSLATSNSTINIPFPAAAVAGDEAFIFVGGGWSVPTSPTGWTQLDNQAGSNFNGFVAHKTLSSGDISTGFVTVAMAGFFDLFAACLVVEGSTYLGAVRSTTFNRSGGSTATDTVTSPSGVVSSDLGVYFGAQRAATLPTVNVGTQYEQATTGSNAAGVLAAGPAGTGTTTAIFTYPGASQSGYYDGIVIVEGVGSGTASWEPFGGGSGGGIASHFGTGAPSTLHTDGDLYFDTSVTPYQEYVQDTGAWEAVGTVVPTPIVYNSTYFGTGAPVTTHNQGDLYFDITSTPYVGYVQRNIPASAASPVIDGSAHNIWSGGATGSANLSTTSTNDVILAYIVYEINSGTMPTVTSVTSSGLTFVKRSSVLNNPGGGRQAAVEVWWATAATTLSSQTITVTLSSSIDDAGVAVFGVSGAGDPTNPWDSDPSLPSVGAGNPGPISLNYSTTDPDDLVIWCEGGNAGGNTSAPSGFTTIANLVNGGGALFADLATAGEAQSVAASGQTVVGTSTLTNIRCAIVDAITGAGAATPTWVAF